MDERREREQQDSGMRPNAGSGSARVTQEQKRVSKNEPPEEQQQVDPKSEEPTSEPSGFMKVVKKVGYSVWLVVMVIGAALAFVAALFLI